MKGKDHRESNRDLSLINVAFLSMFIYFLSPIIYDNILFNHLPFITEVSVIRRNKITCHIKIIANLKFLR